MKYHEFIENIRTHISSQLPATHKVVIQPVMKNNNTIYDGLIIMDPLLNISPTIYLNPFYHNYLNGIELEEIYKDILSVYHTSLPKEDFDISNFQDFNKAKHNIIFKIVNAKKNEVLLQSVPHVIYFDFAMIFLCSVCDFIEDYATILIHNEHMNMWDIDLDTLHTIAMENTPKLLPHHFQPMEKVLEHLSDYSLPFLTDINMYLLTNSIKIYGASSIFYPDLLASIADTLNDNLVIIPSSVHEVLILPEKSIHPEYSSISDLAEMIQDVNETQLKDEEILSDHAYLYNRDLDELEY